MEQLKAKVLNSWLEIDLKYIADKLDFFHADNVVSEELIYSTIRCLDYETSVSQVLSVNYVITIIALM